MSHAQVVSLTLTAGEELQPYRLVKLSGALGCVYADADEEAIGVTTRFVENGKEASVLLLAAGVLLVEAGATIAVNADCYIGADGKLAASGSGSKFKALQAATDGHAIRVLAPANFVNA